MARTSRSILRQFITNHKARIRLIVTSILLIAIFTFGVWQFGWAWTGFPTKTLWDLIELLIVPIVLAFGALWFSGEQRKSELQIAREHEEERLLQSYLGIMTELLLKQGLRNSEEDSEVRSIARVRTYTTLRTVNTRRRTNVMWFLIQAKLIGDTLEKPEATGEDLESYRRCNIVNLTGAPLNGTDLPGANLRRAYLPGVHFQRANLQGADLTGAILFRADLRGANLSTANLKGADLREAKYDNTTKWPDDFDPVNAGAVSAKE